jgi:hypothetical protein
MTSDPFAAVDQAVAAAAADLRRGLEATRDSWNDSARRAFDVQYAAALLGAADSAAADIAAVRARLSAALQLLFDT